MTLLAAALLGFGALTALANWQMLVRARRTKRHTSLILLFGACFTFLGYSLLPAIGWRLGLIAFAIDPGGWIVAWPIIWAVQRIRAPRKVAR